MFCGRVAGWRTIEGTAGLKEGFEFLERSDLTSLADGRYAIQGDDVYALVMRAPSKSPTDARFESHRDYIDIQCLLAGHEALGVLPIGQLGGATPYDAAKDLVFYDTPTAYPSLVLSAGHFAVFFPQDGHQPMRPAGAPGMLHKAVIKVRLRHWEAQSRPLSSE